MKNNSGNNNFEKLLIFGGTTEGRVLVEKLLLSVCPYEVHICVTSEYAVRLLPTDERLNIHVGKLDATGMSDLINEIAADGRSLLCIDATHPYAVEARRNIRAACKLTDTGYERVKRAAIADTDEDALSSIVHVDSIDEAAELLKKAEDGNILITTGSKELRKYTEIPDFKERVYARVLPSHEGIEACESLGLTGKHIIAMQGPFDEVTNYALLMSVKARYMVTKQSGNNGGFMEKLNAATAYGTKLIVVGNPVEFEENDMGSSLEEILSKLLPRAIKPSFDSERKTAYIIGIGPGGVELCTAVGVRALKEADVIIGARRVVEAAKAILKAFGGDDKPSYTSYDPDDIIRFVDTHGEYRKLAFVYSGDIGFYSGAKRISEILEESPAKYKTIRISGISSPVYLLNKLSVDITKVFMSSMHGKKLDLLDIIRKSNQFCILVGDKDDIEKICESLIRLGFPNATVFVGERLSYPDERITAGSPARIKNMDFDRLSVVYAELG